MFNKDERKSLARKNGNENTIWIWNNSSGEHQMNQLRKGIKNVLTLLKLVYMISRLYTTSVWFQNI